MMKLPVCFLAVSILAAMHLAAPAAAADWTPWKDLSNFKPDQASLIQARKDRGASDTDYDIQRIKDGEGDAVNVDEYAVHISEMPEDMTKEALFKHVRHNLKDFLDTSVAEFRPYETLDKTDWESGVKPKLGTIMVFKIPIALGTFDDGGVVVSKVDQLTWIFSPINNGLLGDLGTHPVAGNRQFGLRTVDDRIEFFIRAIDRVYPAHVSLDEGAAFKGADKLWKSFQSKLVSYITDKGGAATAPTPTVPGGNDPDAKPQYTDVCKDASMGLAC